MKQLLEWIVYGFVLVGAFWLITSWQTRNMLSTDGSITIPPVTLPTLSGETAALAPDTTRQTLVYFFAPWCSICRLSMSNLDGLNDSAVNIAVVALDYTNIEEVQEFVASVGLEQEILLGNDQLRALFEINAYPSYYILDEKFRVVSRDMGYTSEFGLRRRVWQASL